jgi:O-antigen ligase
LLFSGFVTVFIGYVQYFYYPSLKNLFYLGWDEHLYRMFSTFLDPNFAGAFFAIFFIFSLCFLLSSYKTNNYSKFFVTLSVSVITLGAVYLTYSRSALLILVISTFAYLYLVKRRKILLFLTLIFFLLIFLSPKSFQTEGTNLLRVTSSEARLTSINQAVSIFQSSPVFGIGFNAYRYAQNKRGLSNNIWQITHSGAGTDNSFLFVAATTGIIGLISYIYLIYKILLLAKINIAKNKYAPVLFSITLGLIVNSFFINSLFYTFLLEWVFLLAALTESS